MDIVLAPSLTANERLVAVKLDAFPCGSKFTRINDLHINQHKSEKQQQLRHLGF